MRLDSIGKLSSSSPPARTSSRPQISPRPQTSPVPTHSSAIHREDIQEKESEGEGDFVSHVENER